MRLISKILIVGSIILTFPLVIALVWQNWSVALGTAAPSLMLPRFYWLTRYGPMYLFWGGVILAVLLIMLLLVTLIWPRPRLLYLHQKSDGQVTVSKKAIENFTLSALRQEPYVGNPKVSAKLLRHKIKLNISGDLMNSINAKQHTADFLKQLESDLRTCLGITNKKQIIIRLVNFNSSQSSVDQPRVV